MTFLSWKSFSAFRVSINADKWEHDVLLFRCDGIVAFSVACSILHSLYVCLPSNIGVLNRQFCPLKWVVSAKCGTHQRLLVALSLPRSVSWHWCALFDVCLLICGSLLLHLRSTGLIILRLLNGSLAKCRFSTSTMIIVLMEPLFKQAAPITLRTCLLLSLQLLHSLWWSTVDPRDHDSHLTSPAVTFFAENAPTRQYYQLCIIIF